MMSHPRGYRTQITRVDQEPVPHLYVLPLLFINPPPAVSDPGRVDFCEDCKVQIGWRSFTQIEMAEETFYLLPLKDDGSPDVPGGYIYLPPPDQAKYSLRFVIEGSSSICRDGTLWVNLPEPGKPFVRQSFRAFE
ncbi:hypothetical protein BDV06DRAFT_126149 [Aspergillus oleicola]